MSSIQPEGLYSSPIDLRKANYRVVENHITIDVDHATVFNYVSTWSNLRKWLPMAADVRVLKGQDDVPAELGDILYEKVHGEVHDDTVVEIVPKVYTVVARIPGILWVVVGNDEGDEWKRWIAHFSTTPIGQNQTLFCRLFAQNCQNLDEPITSVIDPTVNQRGLETLKKAIEGDPDV